MPLTCSCDNSDEDPVYYIDPPEDYSTMPLAGRRKRCSSCNEFIKPLSVVVRCRKWRPARTWREQWRDDEVELADDFMCERCADLFFSFRELGYNCVGPWENMLKLAKEYGDLEKYFDGNEPDPDYRREE